VRLKNRLRESIDLFHEIGVSETLRTEHIVGKLDITANQREVKVRSPLPFHFMRLVFYMDFIFLTCIVPQSHIHIKLRPYISAVTHTEPDNVIFVFIPSIYRLVFALVLTTCKGTQNP